MIADTDDEFEHKLVIQWTSGPVLTCKIALFSRTTNDADLLIDEVRQLTLKLYKDAEAIFSNEEVGHA